MALAFLSYAPHLQANPLDRWTWRYPRPQGSTLRAVTYGNGLYVAVGDSGAIVTSGDGYNWTNQSYGTFPFLCGVGYANGVFAAVGMGGAIVTSSNGVVWTQRASPITNNLWAVAGNPAYPTKGFAQFLAVGDSGGAVASLDSVTWSADATGNSNTLRACVCHPSGIFLAVGDAGTLISRSATVWLLRGNLTANSLEAIAIGQSMYTAGGEVGFYQPPHGDVEYIFYAPNLYDWSAQTFAPDSGLLWMPAFALRGMAFGTNRYVGVGDTWGTLEFIYPGVVMASDTGTNWTELPFHTSENRLYGVTYGNGLFVAVGDAGGILVLSDGLSWSEVTGYHRSAIRAITCSDGFYVASGQPMNRGTPNFFPDFTSLVSSNGVDWVVSTTNLPTMNDLAGYGRVFVGVSGGCIYTTTNGFGWTTNCVSPNTLRGVGCAKGKFVAVGDGGRIYTSANGFDWSDHSVATAGNFNCVAYGNGQYVAAGSVVAASADGVSWSLSLTNPPATFGRLVYANGLFVAAAYIGSSYPPTGEILSSADGMNWQLRYSSGGATITGVAYTSGTFLAITRYGAILKSIDGTNWTYVATLPWVDGGYFSIYYYPGNYSACLCAWAGRFIAAGLDGIVVQSDDVKVPIFSGSPRIIPLGFSFSFNPEIGAPYRIQASSNLDFWQNLYQGTGSNQPTGFTDSNALPERFFRVVSP